VALMCEWVSPMAKFLLAESPPPLHCSDVMYLICGGAGALYNLMMGIVNLVSRWSWIYNLTFRICLFLHESLVHTVERLASAANRVFSHFLLLQKLGRQAVTSVVLNNAEDTNSDHR
jgi:hypothetical protein